MNIRPESAQEQHDEMLRSTKPKLIPKAELVAMIREARENSSPDESSADFDWDPIENAMKENPGLTRETAEEMARAFGF